jgi:hypothetical protein
MGTARIALLSGLVGAVTITLYLMITLSGLMHELSPAVLLQWFGSNLEGPRIFHQGAAGAAVGAVAHVCVCVLWAFVYAMILVRSAWVRTHAVAAGLAFGVVVFLVMTLLVVPLDAATKSTSSFLEYANSLVATTVFFGLPIALSASRLALKGDRFKRAR